MAPKTRKPSGAVPWPLILLEGGEKAGKSYTAALLSASDKVGPTYWVDLGEGSADEYGAIPGVRYEIVEHEGTFASIFGAVEEVYAEAVAAAKTGGKPVVLVIDSMTAEWDWLKDWATDRAKGSKNNEKKLARDPHAEIVVSANYWNDANNRHRKLMKLLMTFPGIAIITARGKYVAVIGSNGQPVEGQKEYRVEGQKTLAFDASCWIRLSRDQPAVVIGSRSVHSGVRPGRDEPEELKDDWTLEWLIFDVLKCDPSKAHVRDLIEPKPERTPEQIRAEAMLITTTPDRIRELYAEAGQLGYDGVVIDNENGQEELLAKLLVRIGTARKAQASPSEQQHKRMGALWHEAGEFSDRDDRLNFTREIIGRDLGSSSELTAAEADKVIDHLQRYIAQLATTQEGAPA